MGPSRHRASLLALAAAVAAAACSGDPKDPGTDPQAGPPAGNPNGTCPIPAEAAAEDVSQPTSVVGTGSPASCTSDAFVEAVARGGVIAFDCGPDPVTITLDRTAKIFNDTGPRIVIDGGGKVTLSGVGARRILYMNTCDQAQVWTTSHCQNSRFFHNACDDTGPDVGGAAVRTLSQYQPAGALEPLPVHVVNSTFGGSPELGNRCSNGGGLSSIGVSHTILNSLFTFNSAIGPARTRRGAARRAGAAARRSTTTATASR